MGSGQCKSKPEFEARLTTEMKKFNGMCLSVFSTNRSLSNMLNSYSLFTQIYYPSLYYSLHKLTHTDLKLLCKTYETLEPQITNETSKELRVSQQRRWKRVRSRK